MRYPCEVAARRILPALRSLIAQALIEEHGFTQTEAARKLGTTQAAVSYYLSSKRGENYSKRLKSDPQAESTIKEVVRGLAMETLSPLEVMDKLCELCSHLRESGVIDNKKSKVTQHDPGVSETRI